MGKNRIQSQEQTVFDNLYRLSNQELFTLIKGPLKISTSFKDSNFNIDERYYICNAILSDYNYRNVIKEIEKLKSK
jgi:hypothetical protein